MEFKKAHPKKTQNFENSTNRFKWSKNNKFLGSLNNVKPVMRREIDDCALEVATIKPFAQENKFKITVKLVLDIQILLAL